MEEKPIRKCNECGNTDKPIFGTHQAFHTCEDCLKKQDWINFVRKDNPLLKKKTTSSS